MKVIKRSGRAQEFNQSKITKAITLANGNLVPEQRLSKETIQEISDKVTSRLDGFNQIDVDNIHKIIEETLNAAGYQDLSIEYTNGRGKKNKKYNDIEEQALALVDGNNDDLKGENANKNPVLNASVRDYLAGIVVKSINNKIIPEDLIQAHKKGLVHIHDLDYSPFCKLHNCDLINGREMTRYDKGFMLGSTLILPNEETPLITWANISSQISLVVSGSQYGGQTQTLSDSMPFIKNSKRMIEKNIRAEWEEDGVEYDEEKFQKKVEKKLRGEMYQAAKLMLYQTQTMMSANGQTPFCSLNLCLRECESEEEEKLMVMFIEEIFKRRIKGILTRTIDSNGQEKIITITPLFPKLLYWLCEGLNVKPGDKYYHLTELAAECVAKRMQPDFLSEKIARQYQSNGQIISNMGCRSLSAPIWEDREYSLTEKFMFVNAPVYPYGTYVEKKSFEGFEKREYKTGYDCGEFAVFYRGNTGWLKEVKEDKVIISEPVTYGRFNLGVCTLNMPYVALTAKRRFDKDGGDIKQLFFEELDNALDIVHRVLKIRAKYCKRIQAKNSPILWTEGAIARLKPEQTVGDFIDMYPGRHSISIGYAGMCETSWAIIGKSNSTVEGTEFIEEVMQYMNKTADEWKTIDHLNYSIYGTPEETLSGRLLIGLRKEFGIIEHITDKEYVCNSYHIDPREHVSFDKKLAIEGRLQRLSRGGSVSYIETHDLTKNIEAILDIIRFGYEHIFYYELNRIVGVCYKCGHEGEMILKKKMINGNLEYVFECPNCGNDDGDEMDCRGRVCGYLGVISSSNSKKVNNNRGRLDDIFSRVEHTDCKTEWDEIKSNND